MLEASNPIQEAIFTMLCELTEENEGEAEEIFNDNDSGFGDLSITIPEAKKEQAKKATERLIVAREPFYSMEDERISDIATRICDAKSITEELVSDLMDGLKPVLNIALTTFQEPASGTVQSPQTKPVLNDTLAAFQNSGTNQMVEIQETLRSSPQPDHRKEDRSITPTLEGLQNHLKLMERIEHALIEAI